MHKMASAIVGVREDILAMNVLPHRFAELFELPSPSELGIQFTVLLRDCCTEELEAGIAPKMYALGTTMHAMFGFDKFAAEFAPSNMVNHAIVARTFRVADDLLGFGPSDDENATIFAVSFFDAEKNPEEDEMYGFAIGSLVIDTIGTDVHSCEPRDYKPLTLSKATAADYRARVGDLYDSGRAVWCRDLVSFAKLMKVAAVALLRDDLPLVETMREFLKVRNTPPVRGTTP